MEFIAEYPILPALIDWDVKNLKESGLIVLFQEVLLIDSKDNGNLRAKPPEILIIDITLTIWIIFMPQFNYLM